MAQAWQGVAVNRNMTCKENTMLRRYVQAYLKHIAWTASTYAGLQLSSSIIGRRTGLYPPQPVQPRTIPGGPKHLHQTES
jgi:hypothetical protein